MRRLLGVALALLAVVIILHFLPVRTHLHLVQRAWEIDLTVHVTVAWVIHIRKTLPISDKVAMALEHMWKRWRATGEPVKVPLQKTVRRFPEERFLRAVRPPVRFFRRRLRIRQIDLHWELGGLDAMQSALLAGFGYSLVGVGLSQASRLVTIDPRVTHVKIEPVFAGPAFRLDLNCILCYRLGNIIVVGVWLLSRLLRDGQVRAWARDSWRRKGVEGSGRAPDSGPDEDGHGKP